jgi:hypothetical protein
VDGVENLWSRGISSFHRLSSCCWLEAKKSYRIHDSNVQSPHGRRQLMRVNSTNVLDEGPRIGAIGHQMNSKVKITQTRRVSRINMVLILAQSHSIPGRPLLAPIYRWPGLKDPVGFNTNYSVRIRYQLVFRLCL